MSAADSDDYVYLKGCFIPQSKARISIYERGFRFGDGVFETMRVSSGKVYQLKLHLNRIKKGLELLKIKFDACDLENICDELIKKNDINDGFCRISISRGVGGQGYLPNREASPTLVIETSRINDRYDDAVDLWVSSYKKVPNESIPSDAKTMQGLNSTLARMQAQENGCFEALMLDSNNNICETSSGNIFWVKGGKLYTPSLKNPILPGTMRHAVIKLSPLEVIEGVFDLNTIKSADEIFITNVAWIALPVKKIKQLEIYLDEFKFCEEIKRMVLKDATSTNS